MYGKIPNNIYYPYNIYYPLANQRLAISQAGTEVETLGNIWDVDLQQNIPINKVKDKAGLFYTSKMAVDDDGSFWAYHPNDTGIDSLSHAYYNGIPYGLVTDQWGNPVIQKDNDPAPGYYVSPTSLMDWSKSAEDPTAYANAQRIPYIVLPIPEGSDNFLGAKMGDYGIVINKSNGKFAYVCCGDIYPLTDRIGEGSSALAEALGLNCNPRRGGVFERIILYIVFTGSGGGNGRIPTIEEIVDNGRMNFEAWGGWQQVQAIENYD